MLVVALLIACGGAGEPSAEPIAEVAVPKHGLNVAKELPPAPNGAKSVKIEVLLTGDPSLNGVLVDAGEVWVDVMAGGMVLDENMKPIARPDITDNVRSISLKGVESAEVLAEQPDDNDPTNVLKKVRANGVYKGCEFAGSGATMCFLDVGPQVAAPTVPKNAGSQVPSASFTPPPAAAKPAAPPP
jgi:hypothetical protein